MTIAVFSGSTWARTAAARRAGRDGAGRAASTQAARGGDRLRREPAGVCRCKGGLLRRPSHGPRSYRARPRRPPDVTGVCAPLTSRRRSTTTPMPRPSPKRTTRPTMHFVALKSEAQLDVQTLHRVRDQLVGERTALTNQIRSAPCWNVATS